MKKSRYFKTLVCLLVGLLVLTGSAYANYDNANGYTMYKNGIKEMLYVENFSADGVIKLEYNGEVLANSSMEYMYDRNGTATEYSKSWEGDDYEYESWIQNSKRYYKNDNGSFDGYEMGNKGFNDSFLSSSKEDKEMVEKIIRFMELSADTFVGDLKNNFVQSANDGGKQSYQINLKGQQIPAYVNAGLSVIFSSYAYADNNHTPTYVVLEDALYESDDIDGDQLDELYTKGYEVIDNNGGTGIAYVVSGDDIRYYPTQKDYYDAVGIFSSGVNMDEIFRKMGTDPVIDSANCYITFDEDGRILENRIDGTLTGTDSNGNKHSMTLTIDLNLYNYGTTKIEPIDVN